MTRFFLYFFKFINIISFKPKQLEDPRHDTGEVQPPSQQLPDNTQNKGQEGGGGG